MCMIARFIIILIQETDRAHIGNRCATFTASVLGSLKDGHVEVTDARIEVHLCRICY